MSGLISWPYSVTSARRFIGSMHEAALVDRAAVPQAGSRMARKACGVVRTSESAETKKPATRWATSRDGEGYPRRHEHLALLATGQEPNDC